MKIGDLGEFPFLRRLRHLVPTDPRVLLGLGDDCAAVTLADTVLLTTDALIENVHFRREWTPFDALGEKAFSVNASDIAAMGGEATFALLSLGVPRECLVEELEQFFAGFLRAAAACDAALIGGNMSTAPSLMVSVTLLGRAPYGILSRAGAQVGDDLYVSGTLGDAALGLRTLQMGRPGAEARWVVDRFLRPTARLAVGRELAARQLVHAMIDVSDGLLQDLGHLCEESGVGAVVNVPALPLSAEYRAMRGSDWNLALSGGEDYELLFCAPATQRVVVESLPQDVGCAVTRIGTIVSAAEGICVRGPGGVTYPSEHVGFDHFREA